MLCPGWPASLAIYAKVYNPANDYTLDTTEFDRLLRAVQQHRHRRLLGCPVCIEQLQQAAALYRSDCLKGFTLDSQSFEDWLRIVRERYQRAALWVFEQLALHHYERGAYPQAEHDCRRQLELEPWREEAHQLLMRAGSERATQHGAGAIQSVVPHRASRI